MGNYRQGKLITIEGVDGVGKNTQSLLLRDKIKEMHGDCGFFSFPRYDTPTGKKVAEYLNTGAQNLSLLRRAELYSNDRKAARLEILDYLMRGVDVVCDRYVDSNVAFFSSLAKLTPNTASNYDVRVREFIKALEYKQYNLPHPDITFILTMPFEKSRELVLKKDTRDYTKEKLDVHERNTQLMEITSKFYESLVVTTPGEYSSSHYKLIDCYDPDSDSVRTVESIHKQVLEHYTDRFYTYSNIFKQVPPLEINRSGFIVNT